MFLLQARCCSSLHFLPALGGRGVDEKQFQTRKQIHDSLPSEIWCKNFPTLQTALAERWVCKQRRKVAGLLKQLTSKDALRDPEEGVCPGLSVLPPNSRPERIDYACSCILWGWKKIKSHKDVLRMQAYAQQKEGHP